jgi:hypothetical protein
MCSAATSMRFNCGVERCSRMKYSRYSRRKTRHVMRCSKARELANSRPDYAPRDGANGFESFSVPVYLHLSIVIDIHIIVALTSVCCTLLFACPPGVNTRHGCVQTIHLSPVGGTPFHLAYSIRPTALPCILHIAAFTLGSINLLARSRSPCPM